MFQRILVPLDGSQLAEQALPVAARLAKDKGATLLLLRVVDTFSEYGTYAVGVGATLFLQEAVDKELAEAAAYLARIAHTLQGEGIKTQVAIDSGQAASYILEVIREQELDFIVLCSHGTTGFQR